MIAGKSLPFQVSLSAVHTMRGAIGTKRTLDTTPPSFNLLEIQDPTAASDSIVISFALNEPGTAYCRATRVDSGEIASDMHLASSFCMSASGKFLQIYTNIKSCMHDARF